MGKAMSNSIKSKAKIVMSEFKEKLDVDFEKNKNFLKGMNLPLSKLTINLMAGYITRTIKKERREQEMIEKKMDQSKTPVKKLKEQDIRR